MMRSGGLSAADGTLSSLATTVTAGSDLLEGLAPLVPPVPSAGDASLLVAELMTHLVTAASVLSTDALEAAARLTTSSTTYASADQCSADALLVTAH
ncbi:hypothetical protein [Sanguibacter antarcticus]|uniref:Uncharacterized protein n=1 Tax=Sanguibacter antarcticus TaxID=372484 RepID=A0A2A9E6E7_9MICO|nr:hypothetical protein [Sanguibacter antarcticus]PFG34627.1 hypothetical protein ATL42_2544 [Sanguibacter antarcticus]